MPLREEVIIRGTNRPNEYPTDRDAGTLHFAGLRDGEVVCCATFVLTEWFREPAYQLRGMATAPALQGTGIGSKTLLAAEEHILLNTDVRQLWCNARTGAVPFYKRLGWSALSEPFDIPNVGPHVKMCKRLY